MFAELRREAPLSWHRPAQTELMPDPDDPGFWAVTRHADISTVSKDAVVFASGNEFGGVMLETVPPDVLEAAHSILAMDAPRHAKLRKVISSVFTPRRGEADRGQIRGQATLIVDGVAGGGEFDFVERVSARLPMWTISAQAEVEGARLTDEEIAAFFVLLCVAGNDTTRQTSSHTIKALHDFPDQREALRADYDGRIETGVEEFVRWASPVLSFRRTARVDTEVGGQRIAAGEKVVMFYRSGNGSRSSRSASRSTCPATSSTASSGCPCGSGHRSEQQPPYPLGHR